MERTKGEGKFSPVGLHADFIKAAAVIEVDERTEHVATRGGRR